MRAPRSSAARLRLVVGLAAVACCSTTPSSPTGLFSTPAGLALSGRTLLIANQDADELHAFDVDAGLFVPAPSVLFPLSVPTVRRPGPLCADQRQAYVASTVEPRLSVVDAFNDETSHLPISGLRELGRVDVPGIVTGLVCAPSPGEVLSHETAVAGSPGAYQARLDAGQLVVDGPGGLAPGGGPDERHVFAALPTAAIAAVVSGAGGTSFVSVENDISGAACPDAGLVESCTGAAAGAVCATAAFCPSVTPLATLPGQPADCHPEGPPIVGGFDVVGSNPGTKNLGMPTAEPVQANLLVASDRSSTCAAAVDLASGAVSWMQGGAPMLWVAALPALPGTCIPGGTLFAAALDSESCERSGPPPVGGYNACNGIVFFDPADVAGPFGGRVPEPLPAPFVPRRPLPPVRVDGIVTSLAFVGPALAVGGFSGSLPAPVPSQVALIAGTTVGDLDYIDVGIGTPLGGTADGGGGWPCPPAYFAPRILDQSDYVPGLAAATIGSVNAVDGAGVALDFVSNSDVPVTSDGGALPAADRQGAAFNVAPAGQAPVTCYGLSVAPANSFDVCVTDGMVQHGAAEDENVTVTYEGALPGLSGLGGSVNGATLSFTAPGDLATYLGADGGAGPLVTDQANLAVQVTASGAACGSYAIASVQPSSLTLAPQPAGPALACAQGSVTFSVVAGGGTPYLVQGTESGFLGLWPADGTLQLVTPGRWQYPADLVGMARGAQQLADMVFGPQPASAAPGRLPCSQSSVQVRTPGSSASSSGTRPSPPSVASR